MGNCISDPQNYPLLPFSSTEIKKFGNNYDSQSPEVQTKIRSQCVFCNIPEERILFQVVVHLISLNKFG